MCAFIGHRPSLQPFDDIRFLHANAEIFILPICGLALPGVNTDSTKDCAPPALPNPKFPIHTFCEELVPSYSKRTRSMAGILLCRFLVLIGSVVVCGYDEVFSLPGYGCQMVFFYDHCLCTITED